MTENPHFSQFSVPVVTSCPLRARIKIEFPFLLDRAPCGDSELFLSRTRKGQLVTGQLHAHL